MPDTRDKLSRLADQADEVLDATGLDCPQPVLRARRQLNKLAPGQCLLVLATDPHSTVDFQAFCARTHMELSDHGENRGVYYFMLKKP